MRGKKQCPQCGALVGPRLAVCQCGHEFTFKAGKTPIHRKAKAIPSEKPHENLTDNPSDIIGVDDREALDSFIEQLQACRGDSNRTGGCYSAFLHCKGGHIIQVEVWLPMKLR